MMRYIMLIGLLGICGQTYAHEFLPTYPKLRQSFVPGVLYTQMELFNKRENIRFYELEVFDSNWKKVSFATTEKITKIEYLEKKQIDVYIRKEDKSRATYICSKSKILVENTTKPIMASRICSKIK